MNSRTSSIVLNTLLELNNERISAYQSAILVIEELDLRNLFSKFIATSIKCKNGLLNELSKMGNAVYDSAMLRSNPFTDIKEEELIVTNDEQKIVLCCCVYGDHSTLNHYSRVLARNENDVTNFQYAMINIQHTNIREDYQKIRNVCESMSLLPQ